MATTQAAGGVRLVLQLGTSWARFGLAGELKPRTTVDVTHAYDQCIAVSRLVDFCKPISICRRIWRPILADIFKNAYEICSDKSILYLITTTDFPSPIRDAIEILLLQHWKCERVERLDGFVTPLLCQGLESGLVLDIGRTVARCVSVAFGNALAGSFCQTYGLGTEVKTLHIDCSKGGFDKYKRLLTASDESKQLNEELTVFFDGVSTYNKENELEYRGSSLPDLLIDVLYKTPMVLRPVIIQNVVITGGLAEIPGFRERVFNEFKANLAHDDLLKGLLKKDCMYLGQMFIRGDMAAWVGGSIFGSSIDV